MLNRTSHTDALNSLFLSILESSDYNFIHINLMIRLHDLHTDADEI